MGWEIPVILPIRIAVTSTVCHFAVNFQNNSPPKTILHPPHLVWIQKCTQCKKSWFDKGVQSLLFIKRMTDISCRSMPLPHASRGYIWPFISYHCSPRGCIHVLILRETDKKLVKVHQKLFIINRVTQTAARDGLGTWLRPTWHAILYIVHYLWTAHRA